MAKLQRATSLFVAVMLAVAVVVGAFRAVDNWTLTIMAFSSVALVAALLSVTLVCASWHFGERYGRLAEVQDTTNRKVLDFQTRLAPLEEDVQRRRQIRRKVRLTCQWLMKKLGLQ
jgi:membrane protein implicated in regulation of membrane protease activity